MIRKENNGIVWFEFEQLQPFAHIGHAVFSRKAATQCLDLSMQQTANKRAAFTAINLPTKCKEIHGNQVHKDGVFLATEKDPEYIDSCDAFISNTPHRALCIRHADCQAAFFYDMRNNSIAAVHCGWRGSVKNIYKKTIDEMILHFGSRPEDLLACICPSLGPNAAQFIHYETELPHAFWQFQTKPAYFDFWNISRWQLENEGIRREHIEIAEMCTFENKELFFSYRRDKSTERNMSTIWINQK